NYSIGQRDMQATPLQLASAISNMAMRGQRKVPFLLLGEQIPSKTYIKHQPTVLEPIVLNDNKYWDIVIKAMQEVITSPQGTAYSHFGHGYTYTIAGKTGTAALSKRRVANEEDKQESM